MFGKNGNHVRRAVVADKQDWFNMRKGLWTDAPDNCIIFDMDEVLESEDDAILFAFGDKELVGMIEVSLRENGEACETSPVGHIEAWFAYPGYRVKGAASAPTQAA